MRTFWDTLYIYIYISKQYLNQQCDKTLYVIRLANVRVIESDLYGTRLLKSQSRFDNNIINIQ